MTFTYSCPVPVREIEPDKKLALFKARKMLPEYVFDTTQLEKNPVTFPEVQTLLDGTTIGGHKVSDVEQVLNIRDAWNALMSTVSAGTFTVDKDTFNSVHACIARGEALEWGKFRRGQIGIAGTETYQAPDWHEPPEIFDRELPVILDAESAVERAVRLFLWGALNQFYWDGNKRTARIMANGILLSAGIGVFNIHRRDILEFNTLMVDFYETQDANAVMPFLAGKCVKYYDEA